MQTCAIAAPTVLIGLLLVACGLLPARADFVGFGTGTGYQITPGLAQVSFNGSKRHTVPGLGIA